METKYYNRSNNFSAPIRKEPKPYAPNNIITDEPLEKNICEPRKERDCNHREVKSFLENFKSDDLLLLALIFLLLSDSNSDTLLLLAIGYIFISSHNK